MYFHILIVTDIQYRVKRRNNGRETEAKALAKDM